MIHPITEMLEDQIRMRNVELRVGAFNDSFSYEFSPFDIDIERKIFNEYDPHLEIKKKTPYREQHDRYREFYPTAAQLVREYRDNIFDPGKRAVRTITGLLGHGIAKVDFPAEAELPLYLLDSLSHDFVNAVQKLNKPFPSLLNDQNQYWLASHFTEGPLEERLPFFRTGVFTYKTKNATLTFDAQDPTTTKGTLTVRFDLRNIQDINKGSLNAIANYMEELPSYEQKRVV